MPQTKYKEIVNEPILGQNKEEDNYKTCNIVSNLLVVFIRGFIPV